MRRRPSFKPKMKERKMNQDFDINPWRNYIRKLTRSSDVIRQDKSLEVDDIVQDVHVKLWKSDFDLNSLPEQSVRRIIYRVTANHLADITRSQQFKSNRNKYGLEHNTSTYTDDSDVALRDVLKRHLTERQQRIVAMLEAGYYQKEIAGELGVNEKTVRRDVQKIREVVQQQYLD